MRVLICACLFGLFCGWAVSAPSETPVKKEIINYRTFESEYDQEKDRFVYKAKWREVSISELKPFQETYTKGVLVEIHMGHSGLDRKSAILVPYDKFKDTKEYELAAWNKDKNIALLAFSRWNTSCLNLGDPDADEIIRNHGFKCSSLDVTRMLRLLDN